MRQCFPEAHLQTCRGNKRCDLVCHHAHTIRVFRTWCVVDKEIKQAKLLCIDPGILCLYHDPTAWPQHALSLSLHCHFWMLFYHKIKKKSSNCLEFIWTKKDLWPLPKFTVLSNAVFQCEMQRKRAQIFLPTWAKPVATFVLALIGNYLTSSS